MIPKENKISVNNEMFGLKEIFELSKILKRFRENDNNIIFELNKIDKNDIKDQISEYDKSMNIEKIRKIRYKILNVLKDGDLDLETVEIIKNTIKEEYTETNILQNWSNFGILYTIYYHRHRNNVLSYLNNFTKKIEKDLKISEITKHKLVGFDGAQNQGATNLWFAIYNKTHHTQQSSKQLFFNVGEIEEGIEIEYGLYFHEDKSLNKITKVKFKDYDYKDLLNTYNKFVNDIKIDILGKVETIISKKFKQMIFYGPPGTGKTYEVKNWVTDTLTLTDKFTSFEKFYNNNRKYLLGGTGRANILKPGVKSYRNLKGISLNIVAFKKENSLSLTEDRIKNVIGGSRDAPSDTAQRIRPLVELDLVKKDVDKYTLTKYGLAMLNEYPANIDVGANAPDLSENQVDILINVLKKTNMDNINIIKNHILSTLRYVTHNGPCPLREDIWTERLNSYLDKIELCFGSNVKNTSTSKIIKWGIKYCEELKLIKGEDAQDELKFYNLTKKGVSLIKSIEANLISGSV